MYFLQRVGFGGCLADDMGVGKTPQVLALLETRRQLRNREGRVDRSVPGGAPRSLIYNWRQEADAVHAAACASWTYRDRTGERRRVFRRYDLV